MTDLGRLAHTNPLPPGDHGVHLVIFCSKRYKDIGFAKHCIYGIEQNVQDRIVSRTIVCPEPLTCAGFDSVSDSDLWYDIDRNNRHTRLLDNTWLRQQILKLSVDLWLTGNVLVVDADLFFLQPVQFVNQGRFCIYTGREYHKPYFQTIDLLIGEKKQLPLDESFITDFGIFNTEILCDMKRVIEQKNHECWLEAVEHALDKVKHPNSLSEFELYGTYLYNQHHDMIHSIIDPLDYQMWIKAHQEPQFDPGADEIVFACWLKSRSKNQYQSIWIKP